MLVSEEGRINCDLRYTAFARALTQQRGSGASSSFSQQQQQRDTSQQRGRDVSAEREASGAVAAALEPCVRLETVPKSIVDLDLLVLEDDGAALAAAVAACSVALADAGVELRDLVASCAVVRLPGASGGLVVDPTAEEERVAVGGILVAVMPSLNEITQLEQFGELSQNDVSDAVELAVDAASRLYATMRRVLLASAQQKQQQQQQ